jgi:hypothetical protein
VQDRYAALVRGPSALFPRGFLWLVPAWSAGLALLLEFKGKTPPWYGDGALAGLVLAAVTLLLVLVTVRNNAFVTDSSGIWLGLRAAATRRLGRRRRQVRHVPWAQIEELRIVPRSYGARLDVLLSDAAPIAGWPRALRTAGAAGLLLLLPISYLVRSPGLLTPRTDPPRYRIPLYDVTAADLRLALARLAPATVPVVVLPRWRIQAIRQRRRAGPPLRLVPPAVRPLPARAPADDQERAHGQTAHGQTAYDQAGYDQAGYDQAGYDQTAHGQTARDQTAHDQVAQGEVAHGHMIA